MQITTNEVLMVVLFVQTVIAFYFMLRAKNRMQFSLAVFKSAKETHDMACMLYERGIRGYVPVPKELWESIHTKLKNAQPNETIDFSPEERASLVLFGFLPFVEHPDDVLKYNVCYDVQRRAEASKVADEVE